MAKVTFTKLGAKLNTEVTTFTWNNAEVEVFKYISSKDKYDLINATIQKAKNENGDYNLLLLDIFFHLHLVYLYTNITFTEKQKEDELKLYDILKQSGLLDAVLVEIPDEEYNELYTMIAETRKDIMQNENSVIKGIKSIFTEMPKNADYAAKLVESFDPDKFSQIINLAKNTGLR